MSADASLRHVSGMEVVVLSSARRTGAPGIWRARAAAYASCHSIALISRTSRSAVAVAMSHLFGKVLAKDLFRFHRRRLEKLWDLVWFKLSLLNFRSERVQILLNQDNGSLVTLQSGCFAPD